MMPSCLSLQDCTEIAQVRAAAMSAKRAAKEALARQLTEHLSSTIVEIRLDVLVELLDLAAEGEARRSRAARKRAYASIWTSDVESLVRSGKGAKEIVKELGLPPHQTGPAAAQIKARRAKGGL
jgi:hypothetical protein